MDTFYDLGLVVALLSSVVLLAVLVHLAETRGWLDVVATVQPLLIAFTGLVLRKLTAISSESPTRSAGNAGSTLTNRPTQTPLVSLPSTHRPDPPPSESSWKAYAEKDGV